MDQDRSFPEPGKAEYLYSDEHFLTCLQNAPKRYIRDVVRNSIIKYFNDPKDGPWIRQQLSRILDYQDQLGNLPVVVRGMPKAEYKARKNRERDYNEIIVGLWNHLAHDWRQRHLGIL